SRAARSTGGRGPAAVRAVPRRAPGSRAVRRLLPPRGHRRAARLRPGHAMTAASGRSPAGFYPVFLNLRGRRAVVVGGGAVAEQKVLGLLEAGAHVTVVSREAT